MVRRALSAPPTGDPAVLAGWMQFGLLASGLGLLLSGMAAAARPPAPQGLPAARLLVGGVDLTDVDLSRPFMLTASVPPSAPPEHKRLALQRLRTLMMAIEKKWPLWSVTADVDVQGGRFLLTVVPVTAPPPMAAGALVVG
jgi:hypothetical protein